MLSIEKSIAVGEKVNGDNQKLNQRIFCVDFDSENLPDRYH
jgi:hypothetical protein